MITTAISAFVLGVATQPSTVMSPVGDLDHIAKVTVMRVIDGKLYVGGKFERANRKLVNNVVMWDGTAWTALGKGVDGDVKDICGVKGNIYVCGDFSYAGKSKTEPGIEANRVAKWDGTKWSALSKYTVDRDINCLATDGTNLYMGGNFTKINDATETKGVAKYDGTKITAIGGQFDRAVMRMVWANGKLFAGGIFNEFGDDACAHMAVWDGKSWSELGGGRPSSIYALSTDGKNVYAAGNSSVDMWDGSKWSSAVKTGGSVTWVHAEGSKLYVAGDFTEIAGKKSHQVGIVDGKAVSTLDEVRYSRHICLMPFGGSVVIGGSYGDVQVNEIGGVLKWDGSPKIDKLDLLSKESGR